MVFAYGAPLTHPVDVIEVNDDSSILSLKFLRKREVTCMLKEEGEEEEEEEEREEEENWRRGRRESE